MNFAAMQARVAAEKAKAARETARFWAERQSHFERMLAAAAPK